MKSRIFAQINVGRGIMLVSTVLVGLDIWTWIEGRPQREAIELVPAIVLLALFAGILAATLRGNGAARAWPPWVAGIPFAVASVLLGATYILHVDSARIGWYRNLLSSSYLFFVGLYLFLTAR